MLVPGEVKLIKRAEAKASPNRATHQSGAADPKPGELSMARLKRG